MKTYIKNLKNINSIVKGILLTILFVIIFPVPVHAVYNLHPGDVLITDFEFHPNCLDGNVGAYGAVTGSGYTNECSYSGKKSYKLVFAKDVLWMPEKETEYEYSRQGFRKTKPLASTPKMKTIDWAVFMIDTGPIIDEKTHPVKIQPLDISRFRYLVFWVKGKQGNEKFRIYFRDAHAPTYEAQLKTDPDIAVTTAWQDNAIKISKLSRKIDIENIVQMGLGFGKEDGNKIGNIIYVDNFILVK